MGNEATWPIVWAWRIVPKFSLDTDIECGLEPTEREAKQSAEIALANPSSIAAIVSPIGLVLGEWIRVSRPIFGLKTTTDTVRWIEPTV